MPSILIIAPHPDDAELGMGGAIAKLSAQGHKVHLLDMTNGEPTPLGDVQTRARESAAAPKILGIQRTQLDLPNRSVTHDLPSRHKVAAVIRAHKADWLFLPYPLDAHPDHIAVTRIGEDARFDAKLPKTNIPGDPCYPKRIIYYFCTHLRLNINPTFCLDITDTIEQKMASVLAYESQFVRNKSTVPEMVRTMSGYFGGRIGTEYAEPFFTYEVLGFNGLDQLI